MKNKKWKKFNVTHPELQPGERFLWNVSNTSPLPVIGQGRMTLIPAIDQMNNYYLLGQFASIRYTSKRLGKIAYDNFGKIIPGSKPVFVSEIEFQTFNKRPLRNSSVIEHADGSYSVVNHKN